MPALCLWETPALACADATLWINNGIICREKLERHPINKPYLDRGLIILAKCPICNTKKGKRRCLAVDGYVCTLCCGKTRKAEACQGCSFYKEPALPPKYDQVPAYTVRQMSNSMDLQVWSNAIEGAICAFDRDTGGTITDDVPIRIMELLLDNYYFKEEVLAFDNELIEKGFYQVNQAIQDDIEEASIENIIKVLGVLYFVAKRRTQGGREYLKIVNNYVGLRIAPGVRVRVLD